jgi:hypothetical protein
MQYLPWPAINTPCAGKPARKKHAPKPAANTTNKTKKAQPTQTIEIPGGQGDTFKIYLIHEDEWAEELVTHMDEGLSSWESAGEHLFSLATRCGAQDSQETMTLSAPSPSITQMASAAVLA